MKRVKLWRTAFEQAVDRMKYEPFSWGDNDCVVGLAGNLVRALTGDDPAATYRHAYDSPVAGLKVMQRAGFKNLADFVASVLPEYEHGPSQAIIGDIAAIPDDSPFGYSLGVVNGERILVLKPEGMATVDLLAATRAFKVG